MPDEITTPDPEKALAKRKPAAARLFRVLGPGLITGAADDDPSGIATYSQAGAQFSYSFGWTAILTFPLMAAIQLIAARIGRTTGLGLGGIFAKHMPRHLVYLVTGLLTLANVVNIGADLNAMADASALLASLPKSLCLIAFAAFCLLAQTFVSYQRYVLFLKWITLSLFAYALTLFTVEVDWRAFLTQLFVPHAQLNREFLTTLVAVLGTTISPYLLFWQAGQEAEEVRMRQRRKPLAESSRQADAALTRLEVDTLAGMALSNLIALAIMTTAAATLNRQGLTNIQSATEAAEALAPLAGPFAFALFTLGIVGTGLLAVPVLSGSAGYALAEALGYPCGLAFKPSEAPFFYAILAATTIGGALLGLLPINPIRWLYWSAVLNGIIAVPIMAAMMAASARSGVMGAFTVRGWLLRSGWAATAVMATASGVMGYFWLY